MRALCDGKYRSVAAKVHADGQERVSAAPLTRAVGMARREQEQPH
jgi:hypothetical protein